MSVSVKIVFIIAIVVICFGLSAQVSQRIAELRDIDMAKKDEGRPMPIFSVELMKTKTEVTLSNLIENEPSVFLYFDPFCPHCKNQIREVVNNYEVLKNFRFFFISPYSFKKIQYVVDEFSLNNYERITIARDRRLAFDSIFKIKAVPYIVLYDKNKKERFSHEGEVSSERILSIN